MIRKLIGFFALSCIVYTVSFAGIYRPYDTVIWTRMVKGNTGINKVVVTDFSMSLQPGIYKQAINMHLKRVHRYQKEGWLVDNYLGDATSVRTMMKKKSSNQPIDIMTGVVLSDLESYFKALSKHHEVLKVFEEAGWQPESFLGNLSEATVRIMKKPERDDRKFYAELHIRGKEFSPTWDIYKLRNRDNVKNVVRNIEKDLFSF